MTTSRACILVLAIAAGSAFAGGSNYGVTPGALKQIAGQAREWPVPTPSFARDPAPAPDGNIYIAVMHGNRIARFDTAAEKFTEWELPPGAKPHGLVVDEAGIVWYTGNGNGSIGRLDPKSGKVTEYKVPGGGDPHTIVIDAGGKLWFTIQNGQRVGRLDRASGRIDEYPMSGNPYGLAIDRDGIVWVCRLAGDALGWIDPVSGKTGSVATGAGSLPRRIATAPDGSLWVAYYGNGLLAKLDPKAKRIVKTWALPKAGGERAYAVTADAAGRIWINGVDSETVSVFDPAKEEFRVITLPSKNLGIRKAIIDGAGRYWYMGSHNGRLGVVQ
jgi:virginiamycin B lyase